jgi:hypothetical protein
MTRKAGPATAVVGAADHCGWAVLVTVARDGSLIDRRRVELVDVGLPWLPHHHECQTLPLKDAAELVERVRASAERNTRACLDALAGAVPTEIVGIAIRQRPTLPETFAARITNYWAQTRADSVMYRDVLAHAATARGWFVHWYEVRRVFAEAANALDRNTIEALLEETGAAIGPPWRNDHRVAMAAAIAAAAGRT